MTLGEFKAFIEGMDVPEGDCPTVQQWARIKEKLDSVGPQIEYRAPSLDTTPVTLGNPPAVPPYTVT